MEQRLSPLSNEDFAYIPFLAAPPSRFGALPSEAETELLLKRAPALENRGYSPNLRGAETWMRKQLINEEALLK